MINVFISYERTTEANARRVAHALRGEGFEVWTDAELPAHRAYSEVIQERLAAADAVVVLWSEVAEKSQWVRAEAEYARAHGKLVQVVLDGSLPPMPFNQTQCASLKGWTGDRRNAQWRKVLQSLTQLAEARGAAPAAPPSHVAGPVGPVARSGRWRLGLALAGLLVVAAAGWLWRETQTRPTDPSVAVLPFKPAGEEPALKALAQRATDQTLTAMAGEAPPMIPAPDLRGAALSITGVASGSGDTYTVTIHIQDVRSKAELWSGEVTGPARTLADQSAAEAAARLSCALTPSRRRLRLDPEALSLWMEVCETHIDPSGFEKQHAAGKRLMALAPRFPEAFAITGLVDARWAQLLPPDEGRAVLADARSYAGRALQLDPKLPVGYVVMSMTAPWSGWAEQEDWLRKGLAVAPDFPGLHARLALMLSNVGRTEDANRHSQRAMRLAPSSPRMWDTLLERASGRVAEARISEARAKQLWPDNPRIKAAILRAALADDPAEAIRILDDGDRRPRMSDDDIDAWRGYARVLGGADDRRAETARALTAALEARRFGVPETSNDYIGALLRLGEREAAIRALYRLADSPSGAAPSVLFSREAAALRRDAGFMPLAARLGLLDYWRRSGHWPDVCTGSQPELDCRAAAAKAGV